MPTVVVDHNDVLSAVYSFLLSNGYTNTLRVLQMESRRPFNVLLDTSTAAPSAEAPATAARSKELMVQAIHSGRWDVVLTQYLDCCLLPPDVLFFVYEHILSEMLHVYGVESAAKAFFQHSPIFKMMKKRNPPQHARLQLQVEHFKGSRADSLLSAVPQVYIERREEIAVKLQELVKFKTAQEAKEADELPWLVGLTREEGVVGTSDLARKRARDDEGTESGERRHDNRTAASLFDEVVEDTYLSQVVKHSFKWSPPSLADETNDTAARSLAANKATLTTVRAYRPLRNSTPFGPPLVVAGTSNCQVVTLSAQDGELIGAPILFSEEALDLDLDYGLPASVETDEEGCLEEGWLAVGYRGGQARIYDMHSRKLVRKFDGFDTFGITHIRFFGPRAEVISNHRGYVIFGGFSGDIHVGSIVEGTVLQTVRAAHSGQYVNGMSRSVTPFVVPDAAASVTTAVETVEVDQLCTVGSDGTMRRFTWDGDCLVPLGVNGLVGSDMDTAAFYAGALHASFEGCVVSYLTSFCDDITFPDLSTMAQSPLRFCIAAVSTTTAPCKALVYSFKLRAPLLCIESSLPIVSLRLAHIGTTDDESSRNASGLYSSTSEGLIHFYKFDATRGAATKGGKLSVTAADVSSTAVAQREGGAVEKLVLSTGYRRGSLLAYSAVTRGVYVVEE